MTDVVKRILSLLLVFTMTLSMSTIAFAAESPSVNEENSGTVTLIATPINVTKSDSPQTQNVVLYVDKNIAIAGAQIGFSLETPSDSVTVGTCVPSSNMTGQPTNIYWTYAGAEDVNAPYNSELDGYVLMSVPVTIAAGATGTFNLNFKVDLLGSVYATMTGVGYTLASNTVTATITVTDPEQGGGEGGEGEGEGGGGTTIVPTSTYQIYYELDKAVTAPEGTDVDTDDDNFIEYGKDEEVEATVWLNNIGTETLWLQAYDVYLEYEDVLKYQSVSAGTAYVSGINTEAGANAAVSHIQMAGKELSVELKSNEPVALGTIIFKIDGDNAVYMNNDMPITLIQGTGGTLVTNIAVGTETEVAGGDAASYYPTVGGTHKGAEINTQYDITYNKNTTEGVDGMPAAGKKGHNAEYAVSSAIPSREGYNFEGWSTTNDNTVEYKAGAKIAAIVNEKVDLYAVWTEKEYTITFNTDGGTAIDPIKGVYGSTVTAPANPSKVGHDFVGWDVDGNGVYDAEMDKLPTNMPAENLTITALWTINQYTITFDTDGGNTITPITQDYNTDVTAPADPTKEGYNFVGWEPTVPTKMPAENITVKAKWTVNDYTITFANTGDSTIAPITQEFGTSIEAVADPVKTGHTFAGWDVKIPETMPAKNMTITAKWTVNQYTITFNTDGGNTIAPITQDYGTAVTAPADPSKTGYTFAGWDKTIPTTMGAENITINATWTPITYNISFNGNGNTGGSTATKYNVKYDEEITLTNGFTKKGYTFIGWNTIQNPTDSTPGVSYDADAPVKNLANTQGAEVVLYAQWKANLYTVTFYPGTDGEGSSFAQSFTYDVEQALEANRFTATNSSYGFAGWAESDGGTVKYKDGQSVKNLVESGNVNLYAVWDQNTISYKADPNTAEMNLDNLPGTYTIGKALTISAKPTATGYTFNGWSCTALGIDTIGDPTASITIPETATGNIELTAHWTINQYTITFVDTGDVAYEEITKNFGEAVGTVADPVKTGYTFLGWSEAIPATMPGENKTITAQWKINQYTITFVDTGDVAYEAITKNFGEAVGTVADPVKTGYTFAGWDKEIPATMPAENVTITANWTANEYTITFDTDGGTAVDPITQDYNTAVTAPAEPTKTGYTFAGWIDENKNPVTFPVNMPVDGMELTAKWTINQYTITFDTVGGTTIEPIKQDFNTAVTAPADPTKEGYTFTGWDTEIPATMPAGDMTITAQWKINQYTITFDTVGGTTIEPIKQDFNTAVTAPVDPTKEGHEFVGWDVDKDGVYDVNKDILPTTMPAGDMTIKAIWKINQYTITFVTNGGTAIDPITANYGATVTAPANPTKTGYNFVSWDKTIPTTMPAEDMTITASWTLNTYTITFELAEGETLAATTNAQKPTGNTITYTYVDEHLYLPAAEKAFHTFAGWYVKETDGIWQKDAPYKDSDYAGLHGNVTLVARWDIGLEIEVESYKYAPQGYVMLRVATDSIDKKYTFNGEKMFYTADSNYVTFGDSTASAAFVTLIPMDGYATKNDDNTYIVNEAAIVAALAEGTEAAPEIARDGLVNKDNVLNIADANAVYQMVERGGQYYSMDQLGIENRLEADVSTVIDDEAEFRASIADVHSIVNKINTAAN